MKGDNNRPTGGSNGISTVAVNAHLLDAWIGIIECAGYTPYLRFIPALATRPISGLPRNFHEDMLEETEDVSHLSKTERLEMMAERDCVFDPASEMMFSSAVLNVGSKACRMRTVDLATGYLYLDIRLGGKAYRDICIPTECILDVYAREKRELSVIRMGYCLYGTANAIQFVTDNGEIETAQLGVQKSDGTPTYKMHSASGVIPRMAQRKLRLSVVGEADNSDFEQDAYGGEPPKFNQDGEEEIPAQFAVDSDHTEQEIAEIASASSNVVQLFPRHQ